jgi:dipeptidyl aminopeptidase/acylaminoacyl peptidase
VQAVVSFYGIADLADLYERKVRQNTSLDRLALRTSLEGFLGGPPEKWPGGYTRASPITHVRPGIAPTLLLHGSADTLVPLDQSQRYERQLRTVGARVELRVFEGAPHSFGGGTGDDLGARADAAAVAFLERELKSRSVVQR